jgi:hypothetical protein
MACDVSMVIFVSLWGGGVQISILYTLKLLWNHVSQKSDYVYHETQTFGYHNWQILDFSN